MSDLYEDSAGKVRRVYSEFPVFDGIVVCPDWFLDAHIYRSCPECGGGGSVAGARDFPGGDEGYDVTNYPCPACKDAATAIAEAALREKAARAMYELEVAKVTTPMAAWDDLDARVQEQWGARVDVVLSTVLGQVRYAKEIVTVSTNPHDIDFRKADGSVAFVRIGDTIGILEEAGKEKSNA